LSAGKWRQPKRTVHQLFPPHRNHNRTVRYNYRSMKKYLNHEIRINKMEKLRKPFYIILPILLLITFNSFSQSIEQKDSLNNKLMNAAREIMASAGTCALITLDQQGRSRVRVMDPFLPESDFTVWFGTNPKSRKVDQIKKDPRVTLYYFDKSASGYVMIHGIAQIVNDPMEKEKRWKAEWEAFYPNKPDGYLLIKVSPEWMEVISYAHGIVGDPLTWEPPVVLFESKK